jgi:O-antigen ligase
LVWDIVWENKTWFGPRTGQYQVAPVRVLDPPNPTHRSGPIGRAPPPDITHLPSAVGLDRQQIWAVALQMIEKRPLFGWGPNGVLMNYGSFALPGQARNPPPHAHNLELEILADWGFIGGGIFFALLAVLWWPLLLRVLRGRVESSWELAVVGAGAALLGHGLVDYPLTKQATFVIFWLLCGLATTMTRDVRANAAVHPAYPAPDPPASA